MKISSLRADDALRRLDSTVQAVMFYGPDHGMVRERSCTLIRQIVGGNDDPFQVAELGGGVLRDSPMRLRDEAAVVAFGGGRRIVKVREPRDESIAAFEALLTGSPVGSLVVVEAGDLSKRSAIRKLFEAAANALAVPCYPDEGASLDHVISQVLNAEKIAISSEARDFLHLQLGPDRQLARSELVKIAIYVGRDGTADLDAVQAIVGDTAEASMDELVDAALSGQQAMLDRALARSYADGLQPVAIIRAAARHLDRLLEISAAMEQGRVLDDVISSLRPPVFFKRVASVKNHARLWRAADLKSACLRVVEAEIHSKSGSIPGEAICNRLLMELAQMARRRSQRRQTTEP